MLPARNSSETRYFVQIQRRNGEPHRSSKALVAPSSLTVAGCQGAMATEIARLQKEGLSTVCKNQPQRLYNNARSRKFNATGEAMLNADWLGFRAANHVRSFLLHLARGLASQLRERSNVNEPTCTFIGSHNLCTFETSKPAASDQCTAWFCHTTGKCIAGCGLSPCSRVSPWQALPVRGFVWRRDETKQADIHVCTRARKLSLMTGADDHSRAGC